MGGDYQINPEQLRDLKAWAGENKKPGPKEGSVTIHLPRRRSGKGNQKGAIITVESDGTISKQDLAKLGASLDSGFTSTVKRFFRLFNSDWFSDSFAQVARDVVRAYDREKIKESLSGNEGSQEERVGDVFERIVQGATPEKARTGDLLFLGEDTPLAQNEVQHREALYGILEEAAKANNAEEEKTTEEGSFGSLVNVLVNKQDLSFFEGLSDNLVSNIDVYMQDLKRSSEDDFEWSDEGKPIRNLEELYSAWDQCLNCKDPVLNEQTVEARSNWKIADGSFDLLGEGFHEEIKALDSKVRKVRSNISEEAEKFGLQVNFSDFSTRFSEVYAGGDNLSTAEGRLLEHYLGKEAKDAEEALNQFNPELWKSCSARMNDQNTVQNQYATPEPLKPIIENAQKILQVMEEEGLEGSDYSKLFKNTFDPIAQQVTNGALTDDGWAALEDQLKGDPCKFLCTLRMQIRDEQIAALPECQGNAKVQQAVKKYLGSSTDERDVFEGRLPFSSSPYVQSSPSEKLNLLAEQLGVRQSVRDAVLEKEMGKEVLDGASFQETYAQFEQLKAWSDFFEGRGISQDVIDEVLSRGISGDESLNEGLKAALFDDINIKNFNEKLEGLDAVLVRLKAATQNQKTARAKGMNCSVAEILGEWKAISDFDPKLNFLLHLKDEVNHPRHGYLGGEIYPPLYIEALQGIGVAIREMEELELSKEEIQKRLSEFFPKDDLQGGASLDKIAARVKGDPSPFVRDIRKGICAQLYSQCPEAQKGEVSTALPQYLRNQGVWNGEKPLSSCNFFNPDLRGEENIAGRMAVFLQEGMGVPDSWIPLLVDYYSKGEGVQGMTPDGANEMFIHAKRLIEFRKTILKDETQTPGVIDQIFFLDIQTDLGVKEHVKEEMGYVSLTSAKVNKEQTRKKIQAALQQGRIIQGLMGGEDQSVASGCTKGMLSNFDQLFMEKYVKDMKLGKLKRIVSKGEERVEKEGEWQEKNWRSNKSTREANNQELMQQTWTRFQVVEFILKEKGIRDPAILNYLRTRADQVLIDPKLGSMKEKRAVMETSIQEAQIVGKNGLDQLRWIDSVVADDTNGMKKEMQRDVLREVILQGANRLPEKFKLTREKGIGSRKAEVKNIGSVVRETAFQAEKLGISPQQAATVALNHIEQKGMKEAPKKASLKSFITKELNRTLADELKVSSDVQKIAAGWIEPSIISGEGKKARFGWELAGKLAAAYPDLKQDSGRFEETWNFAMTEHQDSPGYSASHLVGGLQKLKDSASALSTQPSSKEFRSACCDALLEQSFEEHIQTAQKMSKSNSVNEDEKTLFLTDVKKWVQDKDQPVNEAAANYLQNLMMFTAQEFIIPTKEGKQREAHEVYASLTQAHKKLPMDIPQSVHQAGNLRNGGRISPLAQRFFAEEAGGGINFGGLMRNIGEHPVETVMKILEPTVAGLLKSTEDSGVKGERKEQKRAKNFQKTWKKDVEGLAKAWNQHVDLQDVARPILGILGNQSLVSIGENVNLRVEVDLKRMALDATNNLEKNIKHLEKQDTKVQVNFPEEGKPKAKGLSQKMTFGLPSVEGLTPETGASGMEPIVGAAVGFLAQTRKNAEGNSAEAKENAKKLKPLKKGLSTAHTLLSGEISSDAGFLKKMGAKVAKKGTDTTGAVLKWSLLGVLDRQLFQKGVRFAIGQGVKTGLPIFLEKNKIIPGLEKAPELDSSLFVAPEDREQLLEILSNKADELNQTVLRREGSSEDIKQNKKELAKVRKQVKALEEAIAHPNSLTALVIQKGYLEQELQKEGEASSGMQEELGKITRTLHEHETKRKEAIEQSTELAQVTTKALTSVILGIIPVILEGPHWLEDLKPLVSALHHAFNDDEFDGRVVALEVSRFLQRLTTEIDRGKIYGAAVDGLMSGLEGASLPIGAAND